MLLLAKKVLRLLQLAKKTTKVAAAGEKGAMAVAAAPVEAGIARPRRKGAKYNSPTGLANACDEVNKTLTSPYNLVMK